MPLFLCACGNTASQTASKDSIVIATSGEPYRFFPQSSGGCGGDDNLVLCNLYDCLFRLENDGSLSPAIATSCEESEDGLSYTFKLREGVTFHNGYPMTAEDVKFTFDLGSAGPLGKTMLRLVEPTSGEILLEGEDILKFGRSDRKKIHKNMQMRLLNRHLSYATSRYPLLMCRFRRRYLILLICFAKKITSLICSLLTTLL